MPIHVICVRHTYLRNQIVWLTAPTCLYLRQSMCYVIMPHTHQWYKINANEFLDSHKLSLCDNQLTHMVPAPPAEPLEINAFTTRLTFLQGQDEQVNNNLCTIAYH